MNKINNKYQMTPTNQKAGLRDGSSQIVWKCDKLYF
jgi:hypothetical protein